MTTTLNGNPAIPSSSPITNNAIPVSATTPTTTAAAAPSSATIPTSEQQQQQIQTASSAQNAYSAANQTALYVGDLNPNVSEGLLFELFNAVGPVASIRVCRDLETNFSLGYAYVNFNTHADAERALDALNFTPIKGRPCRIMWKQSDPQLRKTGLGNVFIKNLDPTIDHKALYDTFSLFGEILSCKVVTDRKTGESKGYGFVHFETVEAADEAIRKINGMLINGKEVFVGRFLKRTERSNNNAWTNIYVKNIPVHWDEDQLTQLFCECGEINSLVIMKENDVSKGFGFIDYVDHDGAANAIEKFNDFEVKTKEGEEAEKNGVIIKPNTETKSAGEIAPKKDGENVENTEETTKTATTENSGDDETANKTTEGGDATTSSTDAPIPEPIKLTQKLVVCRAQKKTERERELQGRFEKEKQERLSKYQGVNLYVKNLHENIDEDQLRQEFAPYGTITSARIMRDQGEAAKSITDETGKIIFPSKGFGFVCLSSPEEATKAVTELNGKMIMGKPIYVALAQRKDARRMQLEAQHTRQIGRGAMPMQGPGGMYPGAPVFFQGGMPPQAGGMRGNFGYLPQMMPRGMMQQQQPNRQGGGGGGMGMPGSFGRGVYPTMPGAYPQQMNPMQGGPQGIAPRGGAGRQRGRQHQGPGAGMPGQQNIKYTAGARNQPGFNPGMGMQMMQGVPMMQGGMQNGMMMPNMMPQGPQSGNVQMGSGPEPLTAAALANATDEQQKNMIGEKLYPLIHVVQPELAGKITGMLLEMDNPELLHLIESPEALQAKIVEALHVLETHQSQAKGDE